MEVQGAAEVVATAGAVVVAIAWTVCAPIVPASRPIGRYAGRPTTALCSNQDHKSALAILC